jgi:hypothetical protein
MCDESVTWDTCRYYESNVMLEGAAISRSALTTQDELVFVKLTRHMAAVAGACAANERAAKPGINDENKGCWVNVFMDSRRTEGHQARDRARE